MSSEPAILVNALSKCYQIYRQPHDRLKQSIYPRVQRWLGRPVRQYGTEFWALRGVTFEVGRGETVGIIGPNGSGKSTLLQLICGTLTPTSGTVQTRGRIAALLELGAGFNVEFTGRENVRLSCALLGLTQAQAEDRFDDIAAFADIGEFMDQPVKTYSSGMFVRLAFAVNMMVQPDIMVVDEALAVGDMSFQSKCMRALNRMQQDGTSVLFVSHDIGSVKSLCSRAIYLEHGRVKQFGPAGDIAELYVREVREQMSRERAQGILPFKPRTPETVPEAQAVPHRAAPPGAAQVEAFGQRVAPFRYGQGGARILLAEVLDDQGAPVVDAAFDQRVWVRIYFESDIDGEISPNYYFLDDKRSYIVGAFPWLLGQPLLRVQKGATYVVTYGTRLPLNEGRYSLQLELTVPLVFDESAEFLDVIDDAIIFRVGRRPGGRMWAKALLPNSMDVAMVDFERSELAEALS